uniref:Peptidase_M1 domain-containing protein n=1 Tax=Heterorhabditis bacteriophora TaxID=37862 RepID=A0A1I7XM60_HETBA
MQWWEDLWLNEGFATMVEYLGADEISNGYMKMRDFFLVNAVNNALEKDSIASSHPLSFKIDKASEVSEAFDGITYAKGGSVLMMISEVMGEENFNKGLKIYLKQHSYGNAKAADLWRALDKAVPDHVKGPDGKRLNITEFANHFKWDVPVWYQDEKDIQNEKMVWLKRDEPLFIHTNNKSNFAFVINSGMRSFFRQNYDEEGWKRIGQQFQEDHEVYNVRTRMAIISDAYAMALIGELNYGTLLDLVRYIEKEKEYLPWTAMIDGFNVILSYLGTEPESLSIKDYMKTILKQKYNNNSLQYITDHFLDNNTFYDVVTLLFSSILETNIMNVFCRMNSPECIHGYTDLFEKEVLQKCGNNKTSDCVMIAGPLRPTTYCYGIQNGDELVYKKMLSFYQRESVQVEKNYLMVSLGCSKNIVTLKSLLTTALDRKAGVFRLQDVPAIFNTVARNDIGKEFMFNFLLDRWDLIYERFGFTKYSGVASSRLYIANDSTRCIRVQKIALN